MANLSFTQLTTDYSRPMAGAEKWHYDWIVPIPNVQIQDQYFRFAWAGLNPGDGIYNWSFFDQQIKSAIDNGYKFSFGIMSQYDVSGSAPGVVNYSDGGNSAYPEWLHNKFKTESVKDFKYASSWVPNWNSPSYLAALEKFYVALNDHLYSTVYKNVKFSDVINSIDIRGYGNFGEWHGYPWKDAEPSVNAVKEATLLEIIDIHKRAFSDFRLSAMIAGFDTGYWSQMPSGVTYKLLTDSNNAGQFGWRKDSWCDDSFWYPAILENNPNSYNGKAFKTLIMDKWKYAPITGEPCCQSCGTIMPNQINRYHVTSFGNSNYAGYTVSEVVKASKAAGARITLTGGSINTTNNQLTISLNWSNTGISPVYSDYDVIFELRKGTVVSYSLKSSFNPKLFLPGSKTVTDVFNNIQAGDYNIYLIIKDAYRTLPLSIVGRQTDGSYSLGSIKVAGTIPIPNQPPTVNAGSNQTITLPVDSIVLNGSATDSDGTIAQILWSKASGPSGGNITSPNTLITTITNLQEGVYIFNLKVTDNDGASVEKSVSITVNPAPNQSPNVDAGDDVEITLPDSSVVLTGSAYDPDGNISSYLWQKQSGGFAVITDPSSLITNITGLVEGEYVFRLLVTDNKGATSFDDVTITVKPKVIIPADKKYKIQDENGNLIHEFDANKFTITGKKENYEEILTVETNDSDFIIKINK